MPARAPLARTVRPRQVQSVFVASKIIELGGWNPAMAFKLEPLVDYQLIADGRRKSANREGPGPDQR